MRFSVAIPAFNSSATIEHTLESVLRQTVQPHEIVIVDDGSTDNTVSIIERYCNHVRLLRQFNSGVAVARNVLAAETNGDVIAFLDHDDIWHPQYLEIQKNIFDQFPDIGVSFCGHVNFSGYGKYIWREWYDVSSMDIRLLSSVDFLKEYNFHTGPFGSMSYCCVSKRTFQSIGSEPFRVSGVDDSYFCSLASLLGIRISYCSTPLVAYRVISEAQSHNLIKVLRLWVEAFEILAPQFMERGTLELQNIFYEAFAGKRRSFAKMLMGTGDVSAARLELRAACNKSVKVSSAGKTLVLLAATYLPRLMQPKWLGSTRNVSKIVS